jgi:glyoxylase-like metal-dependent hydrolase (beta-lactamase superfamily II)
MKALKTALLSLMLLSGVGQAWGAPDIRLYRLDCGTMHIGDMSMMSDAGHYKGRSYDIVISCYLVKHDDTWMLWDTGFARSFLAGVKQGALEMNLSTTIDKQIKELGLQPSDIRYVALSHAHFDHAGQTNDFPAATLVLQKAERAVLNDEKAASEHFIQPELLEKHLASGRIQEIDGDHDFFGDGTVRAIALPGHTPGHMALQVTLPRSGVVILSGDQWHFPENRRDNQVPTFNFDHDATIDSSGKLERLIARTKARLIIQHEPADNAKLPLLPGYLE